MNLKSNLLRRWQLASAHSVIVSLLLLASAVAPLSAAEKADAGKDVVVNYLSATHPDGIALLPPPPVPGTPEHDADLAEARAVFHGRTPAEEARAMKDASLSIFNFSDIIGPIFQPGKLPKTEDFFEKVKKGISESINRPKENWKRLRPYQIDEKLTLGKPEKSFSYPSGHSTRGTVQALLLAELFPEKKEEILQQGRNVGWDRVLIGKHFATDVFAGRVLGQAIVHELMKSKSFQHDLAEAKAEIAATRSQAKTQ